jgi:hypothetical protein
MSNIDWKNVFVYDAEAGKLYWKVKPGRKVCIGNEAGSPKGNGYLQVAYQGKRCLIHRAIWEMFYGPIPPGLHIDHINGNPSDNRIENLRLATRSENQWNSKIPKNNTSGLKGASWCKVKQKWVAEIWVFGRKKYLGLFLAASDAHAAYVKAANIYHGAFARAQ